MKDVLEKNSDRLIEQVREASMDAQEWSRKVGQLEEHLQHLQMALLSQPKQDSITRVYPSAPKTVTMTPDASPISSICAPHFHDGGYQQGQTNALVAKGPGPKRLR